MLNIVFMGTPDFAVPVLKAIYESGHRISAVVTQPDKPTGRGYKVAPSPVKQWAVQTALPVYQPEKARNSEFIEIIRSIAPDLIVTAAYGQIISQSLLGIPPLGCINVHASLLPKYRGASPIQQALMDGQTVTGITIFYMEAGVDTGDMILQTSTHILPEENAAELALRLSFLGAQDIVKVLKLFENGKPRAYPQDNSLATYCKKIDTLMGKIDWTKDALTIKNLVRGLTPKPGAYALFSGSPIKVYAASEVNFEGSYKPGRIVSADNRNGLITACGKGFLRLHKIQKPGGKVMSDTDFLRGYEMSPLTQSFDSYE